MYNTAFGKPRFVLGLGILAFSLWSMGCSHRKTPVPDQTRGLLEINKVVVLGFRAFMSEGEEADVARDPLSGTIFMAESVPAGVAHHMTDILFTRLAADKRFELISPGQAKGVFSSIANADVNVDIGALEMVQKVGKPFDADAVLGGYIFRWREREGTDFAASRPASAAFNLYLVRPADGKILWAAKFDKTQQPLSENLLDAKTFFRGKGRWMTVEKLAMFGFDEMLKKMSGLPGASEE